MFAIALPADAALAPITGIKLCGAPVDATGGAPPPLLIEAADDELESAGAPLPPGGAGILVDNIFLTFNKPAIITVPAAIAPNGGGYVAKALFAPT